MNGFKWARIVLLQAEDDPYAPYYLEALDHAGLRYETIDKGELADLSRLDVLVLAGYGHLDEARQEAVGAWVRQGGQLICSGSAWSLSPLLGLKEPLSHCSNEVISPSRQDRAWPDGCDHVRFFGGTVGAPAGAEPSASTAGGKTGLSRRKFGKGAAFFVGPHIGQTIAQMQLGRSVECDDIGPADGSARLDDGNLRAEDGSNLDFLDDRLAGEEGSPYFAFPHADVAKEILIRTILEAVENAGLVALMAWHWPRNATATSLLSLDCETFEPGHVQRLHTLMSMYGCRGAWLVALPGYTLDVYRTLRSWQHEIGTLFVTDDTAGWHDEKLKIQHVAIGRSSASPSIIATRPVDGKWRGYTRFYDQAEEAGARLSLSKGGRQPGTSGFLFGTCHPFFPMRKDGSFYLTAELPYAVYLPGSVTSDQAGDAILEKTVARHGCFHIVFRPEAADVPENFGSLRRLLSDCKQRKVEFILPEDLYRFERARRALRIVTRNIDLEGQVKLISDTRLEGLTIMATGPRCEASFRGKSLNVQKVRRYGTTFHCVEIDLDPKAAAELRLVPQGLKAAA
ncbi:MAG: hypothetical protein WAO58_01460 [Fimbriimonadaceae bacterium]